MALMGDARKITAQRQGRVCNSTEFDDIGRLCLDAYSAWFLFCSWLRARKRMLLFQPRRLSNGSQAFCVRAGSAAKKARHGGVEGCETWMRVRLENIFLPRYEEAVIRGTARANVEARASCEASAAGACTWVEVAESGGAIEQMSCPELVEGLVEIGGECVMDEECAGDAHCRLVSCDDGCRGVCEAPLAEGATGCAGFVGQCADGLVCVFSMSRCMSRPAIGGSCAMDDLRPRCTSGAECVEGTCVAIDERRRALGEACTLYGAPCVMGLLCDGSTCVDAPAEGESCVGDRCGVHLLCSAGRCEPEPVEGEPCIPGALGLGFSGCPGLLTCSDGICVSMHSNGEPCSTRGECVSGRCESGQCVPPPYRSEG